MSNIVIKDIHGNVIEGATITFLPSAEFQARKDARKACGLSDRGRIPATVKALALGVFTADDLSYQVNVMESAVRGFQYDMLSLVEHDALIAVINAKKDALTVHANMINAGITLDDLTKGGDDE